MSEAMTATIADTIAETSTNVLTTTKNAFDAGAADARALVEETWPKIADAFGKGVYNSAYYVSFGVTFPVLLLAKSIPQNNKLVEGLVDGARRASMRCDKMFSKK